MRFVFLTLSLIVSASVYAADPPPCSGSRLTCKKAAPWTGNGLVHATLHPIDHANENAGTYYSRGSGKSCNEAYSNGLRRMMDTYDYLLCGDQIKCGVNGGAYLQNQACNRTPDGTHYAWVVCRNIYHSPNYSVPQNDSAAGFILLQSLIRDEKLHGNR